MEQRNRPGMLIIDHKSWPSETLPRSRVIVAIRG
jgi:hypothetical protein